jgi:predicted ATPase with chaperone activity
MGDHLCTCITHSGAKKGRHCGDIQLEGYLENVTDPVPLVLDLHINHDRLQKHSRRCDTAHDGGFAIQSTFFGALQRRAAPENLM